MDRNRVIGNDNQMPWHLPEDLAYFKRITMGHTVIMGRKTYLSIGKALPGRKNIVLSRDPDFEPKDAQIVDNLLDATEPGAFIIGGASIFEQTIDLVDTLYITHIDAEIGGDRKFPKLDWHHFRKVSCEEIQSSAGYKLSFCKYERI